jgi:hypothetical protein
MLSGAWCYIQIHLRHPEALLPLPAQPDFHILITNPAPWASLRAAALAALMASKLPCRGFLGDDVLLYAGEVQTSRALASSSLTDDLRVS